MIYWSVTTTVAEGKREESLQWLKKMAQYAKEHLHVEVEIFRPLDGDGGRLIWLEKHNSLADWEKADKLFDTDTGAVALQGEAKGLFTASDVHFWRTVD